MAGEFRRHYPDWNVRRSRPGSTTFRAVGPPRWRDTTGTLQVFLDAANPHIYWLAFLDSVFVRLDFEKKTLRESAPASIPRSTLDHFLLDQVLPRMLSIGENLVLHAGAVRIQDSAIAFLGASGAGKSTLSASFHQVGHSLIGDDAVLVRSNRSSCELASVYPSLRLLSDSREALFCDSDTHEVAGYSSKLRIELPDEERGFFRPLKALIFLSEQTETVRLRRLAPAEACVALIGNSFALDPTNEGQARRNLEKAASAAQRVPAFRLNYPRAYEKLPLVRETILDSLG